VNAWKPQPKKRIRRRMAYRNRKVVWLCPAPEKPKPRPTVEINEMVIDLMTRAIAAEFHGVGPVAGRDIALKIYIAFARAGMERGSK